jgi:Ca-activated chloride channel family protein
MGVSALGFGANYDENVLDAIASAGSGRYAYINDPSLARVDLARAVLAQAGIVADHIEIKLQPCAGVEVLQMLPASQRRFGADGVTTSVGDVFKDEARSFAVEFRLDLQSGASGRLADVVVEGRGPGGVEHSVAARFEIDIRSGARVVDPVGAREVLTVQADAARAVARVQADRREMVAAAATLREVIVRIDALEGFVKNDGSMLAELREELADQAARCERRSTNSERCHQRKSELAYKTGAPFYSRPVRQEPPIRAQLVGVEGPVRGRVFRLWTETLIGRSSRCDVTVEHESMSRNHARVQFLDDHFLLVDLGATTGTTLNAAPIQSARLANGDVVRMGDAVWRFEISARQASLPGI